VEHIRWIAAGELQEPGNEDTERSRHIKGFTSDLLMLLSTEALFDQVQPSRFDTGVPT
jgi:chemotaxis signal transduction protein